MALRGRNIENFDYTSLAAWSWGLPICVSPTTFQKSSIGWPQQPLAEKMLKFNLILHDSTQDKYFFKTSKMKLNSRTWMTLKSPVVIFQALEPLQPQWPQQPQRPQRPQRPQWPWQPHFIKRIADPDDWIIPGTKITNNGPFLLNGSLKNPIFH